MIPPFSCGVVWWLLSTQNPSEETTSQFQTNNRSLGFECVKKCAIFRLMLVGWFPATNAIPKNRLTGSEMATSPGNRVLTCWPQFLRGLECSLFHRYRLGPAAEIVKFPCCQYRKLQINFKPEQCVRSRPIWICGFEQKKILTLSFKCSQTTVD